MVKDHMPAAAVEPVDVGGDHWWLLSARNGDIFVEDVYGQLVCLEALGVSQPELHAFPSGEHPAPAVAHRLRAHEPFSEWMYAFDINIRSPYRHHRYIVGILECRVEGCLGGLCAGKFGRCH